MNDLWELPVSCPFVYVNYLIIIIFLESLRKQGETSTNVCQSIAVDAVLKKNFCKIVFVFKNNMHCVVIIFCNCW